FRKFAIQITDMGATYSESEKNYLERIGNQIRELRIEADLSQEKLAFACLPAIIVMVMALQDKKKHDYGGQMSYMQGLVSGIILSAFIALISPLTQWITSFVISPEYFPNVIKRSVELGY